MSKGQNKPTQAQARQEARQAAKAEVERLKAAKKAKERRNRLLTIIGAVVLVVVVAVVVAVVVLNQGKAKFNEVAADARPLGAQVQGDIAIGTDGAPGGPAPADDAIIVRVYSDYMCPGCRSLEEKLGTQLEDLAKAGTIKLELQPVSFLDRMSSGTKYSTRATNAAMTVAKLAPDKFLAFHAALFDGAPAENTEGLTDEQIVGIATMAGVPEDVAAKFKDNQMDAWVTYATDQAAKVPVTTTPSIRLGTDDDELQEFTQWSNIPLEQAIAAVKAGKSPDEG